MLRNSLILVILMFAIGPPFAQKQPQVREMARSGQRVRVVAYQVQASKRDQYERFVHDIFWPGAAKLSPKEQQVFRQTRVLHPTKVNPDGSYTYTFIMDPVIEGADYNIESLMHKIYGKEKGSQFYKLFVTALVPGGKYVDYMLTQSKD
ncbi:hypothetical protein [Telluribacter sp.]|jgi:predicted RNA-binding protein|uniref:hypothetical protein n=1 Tax=Telluribacter sp. TaxID=1978767 RepID=UPI002E0E50E5|nr:hypothetical protein [Telluribacter sp.]